MKHKIFLIFILCFTIIIHARGQSMVHDAFLIRNYYNESTKKLSKNRDSIISYVTLMKTYLPKTLREIKNLNVDAVLTTYEDNANPFFIELLPTGRPQSFGNTGEVSLGMPGILNSNVTQVADGLAKFLVKRTKEELSLAFFEKFKNDMNSEKYSDLKIIFPQTAKLLNQIDNKIYQFSAYLTDLREVFILDLHTLPSSALFVINLPKYKAYFTKHPEMKSAVQAGLFISNIMLVNDSLKHIGNVIDSMEVDKYFSLSNERKFDSVVNGSLKTARLISNSLRSLDTTGQSTNTQRYWVSADSLFLLFKDPVTVKIYLGLLYEKAKTDQITFSTGNELTNIFINTQGFIDSIQNQIINFYSQVNAFENYRLQFRKIQMGLQTDSLKLFYYGMFNSSITIIEEALSFVEKIKPGFDNPFTENVIPPIKDVMEIYMYVNQKKYAPAILSIVSLYKGIFKDASENEKKNLLLAKLLQYMSTYGTFIAEVAKAENSDEVANIIEKTVLPTGSSYIKKHSITNIALQAYTGFYGGKQRQATDKNFVTVGGIYAPIGIAASWGSKTTSKNGKQKSPSSFSLFLSIIDIGPLVSYRFSNANDSLANDIDIRLNQILSPGFHLVYGIPKTPLSFGVGGNWTPLLTKVESNAINVMAIEKRPFRFQAFFAVDIPFLNFYNKPR